MTEIELGNDNAEAPKAIVPRVIDGLVVSGEKAFNKAVDAFKEMLPMGKPDPEILPSISIVAQSAMKGVVDSVYVQAYAPVRKDLLAKHDWLVTDRGLGSEDFETRKKAFATLEGLGVDGIPVLAKGLHSDDTEVRVRCRELWAKLLDKHGEGIDTMCAYVMANPQDVEIVAKILRTDRTGDREVLMKMYSAAKLESDSSNGSLSADVANVDLRRQMLSDQSPMGRNALEAKLHFSAARGYWAQSANFTGTERRELVERTMQQLRLTSKLDPNFPIHQALADDPDLRMRWITERIMPRFDRDHP